MKNEMPPVKYPVRYSELGTYIYDAEDKMIADVRGWGWIQKLKEPELKQDAMGEFIAAAINEKMERESNAKIPAKHVYVPVDTSGPWQRLIPGYKQRHGLNRAQHELVILHYIDSVTHEEVQP